MIWQVGIILEEKEEINQNLSQVFWAMSVGCPGLFADA